MAFVKLFGKWHPPDSIEEKRSISKVAKNLQAIPGYLAGSIELFNGGERASISILIDIEESDKRKQLKKIR